MGGRGVGRREGRQEPGGPRPGVGGTEGSRREGWSQREGEGEQMGEGVGGGEDGGGRGEEGKEIIVQKHVETHKCCTTRGSTCQSPGQTERLNCMDF